MEKSVKVSRDVPQYDHATIEKKWQKNWVDHEVYKTKDPEQAGDHKKFYVLDMFPYPSGEGLHVGHPKGYIATDIISRMKRMQGFNVLHPMGFDAFGLPAETYAIKTKTNPAQAVAVNVARYKKQLEILGLDYDWSREVNTTDPKFYKWTQWIFLKLLEKGLAFESNEPVNWCPVDKTVLANEDVENGRCERCGSLVEKRALRQWVLKITDYADRLLQDLDTLDWPESIKESQRNWIGRSEGAEIPFTVEFANGAQPGSIPVFTTRPDTIYGATALILSPEHPWVTLSLDENHSGVLTNAEAVRTYVQEAAIKSEIDRTDAKKEKTGVKLEGVWARNPATQEHIPVFVADYVLADYGTGAVMSVPAHDERDFQFAQTYGIEVRPVVIPRRIDHKNSHVPGKDIVFRNAVIAVVQNPQTRKFLCLKWKKQPWTTFVMGGIETGEDSAEAARREVIEETGYKNITFIRTLGGPTQSEFYAAHKGVNRIAHTQAVLFELENDDRDVVSEEEESQYDVVWISADEVTPETMTHIETDVILENMAHDIAHGDKPYTGAGILINSASFSMKQSDEVKKEITESVGGTWVTKYKLRDWVFSRQRYWGEPIPVLHDGETIVPLSEKDLPLMLPAVTSYEPTDNGLSPLAQVTDWVNVTVGEGSHAKTLMRETNTMPTWAGSSWYYLRYMDPHNDTALIDPKKEHYWNTVDMYVGGAEHATRHLIYARFWHKFLYDIGVVSTKEPFQELHSVGLIIADDGRKMSKRFGNVINPDDIVATYGADTLRLYEMFLGPFDQTSVWSTENIIGTRRFLEKVWRLQVKVEEIVSYQKSVPYNVDLEALLHKTIEKITADIRSMRFNTSVSALMILVNAFEKEIVVHREHFGMFLKLLAPFAPHITEELWSNMGYSRGESTSIHHESWPVADPTKMLATEVRIMVQVNGKTRGQVMVAPESPESTVLEAVQASPELAKWIGEYNSGNKVIYVKNRLINIITNI